MHFVMTEATKEVRKLIEDHCGNISTIALMMGLSRQGASYRLRALTVRRVPALEYARRLRRKVGSCGPNGWDLPPAELAAERHMLVRTIAESGGQRHAAKILGVGSATISRRCKAHGITPAEVAARRK
jgi:DNA invertase Pin-like site-specific DNA recombinase